MHVADGFVYPSVAIAGYAVTGGLTWLSLRHIDRDPNPTEKIPKASLLTAGFFVASLIHIPIPPTSVHLVLNGLMGIVLGYYAFPAILIGLFFQAVFFNFGGLSTLGLNAALMGFPALLAHFIFRAYKATGKSSSWLLNLFAFGSGAISLALSAIIFTGIVVFAIPADLNPQFERAALSVGLIGYGLQALLEGVFTAMLVSFFLQVKPELIESE